MAFPALAEDEPGIDAIYWPNFKWLAEESQRWMLQRETVGAESRPPTVPHIH